MIRRLVLCDYVLLERLELELGPGLNALSGGSGEGKTLIVESLRFLCGAAGGARGAGKGIVRQGASEATVAAELEVASRPRREALAATGLVDAAWAAGDEPLRLLRAVDRRGRSRAEANGAPVTLATLRTAGPLLIELFGQGQAPQLGDEQRQLEALDAAAGCAGEAQAYARQREEALRLARERDALLREARERAQAGAREEDERAALDALAPLGGEWDALLDQEERLDNAASDLALLGRSVEALSEDEEASLALRLRQVLGELSRRPPGASADQARRQEALEALEGALAQLEAGAELLRRERDGFEIEPAEAERVRARLATWRRTARQVGRAPEALAARHEQLQARPDAASLLTARREREAQLERSLAGLVRQAAHLTRRRGEAAGRLSEAVLARLPGLGMPQGRFEVALVPAREVPSEPPAVPAGAAWDALEDAGGLVSAREPAPGGRERARFLFAAGPGTDLAPLACASGGELSRLLLALASCTASAGSAADAAARRGSAADAAARRGSAADAAVRTGSAADAAVRTGSAADAAVRTGSAADAAGGDPVPVLVFDEIDANVGARLGAAVGDCLAGMARSRQVLLVTHLAPVAARAARHLRVVREGATSRAEPLTGEARLEELAVMIRGHPVTEAARAQARELLDEAAPARAPLAERASEGESPRRGRRARSGRALLSRPSTRA